MGTFMGGGGPGAAQKTGSGDNSDYTSKLLSPDKGSATPEKIQSSQDRLRGDGDLDSGGKVITLNPAKQTGDNTPQSQGSAIDVHKDPRFQAPDQPGKDPGKDPGDSGEDTYREPGPWSPVDPGEPTKPDKGGDSDIEKLLKQVIKGRDDYEAHTLPDLPDANPERINHVDESALTKILKQIVDSQKKQGAQQVDYGVERGVNELQRALEDASPEFQKQRDQISADEAKALDNQALYAEARGDRGGIGQSQYASIQNTAAQNMRAVNDAQVKLGTDTARQIADLRAQGEFTKADQLLSITQSYLSQLMNLKQWAMQTNLGVDEFNSQLQQWVDEYNMNKAKYLADLDMAQAQITGVFADGTKTKQTKDELWDSLASSGSALLNAGVMPSKQQLEAMGLTVTQAKAMLKKINAKK